MRDPAEALGAVVDDHAGLRHRPHCGNPRRGQRGHPARRPARRRAGESPAPTPPPSLVVRPRASGCPHRCRLARPPPCPAVHARRALPVPDPSDRRRDRRPGHVGRRARHRHRRRSAPAPAVLAQDPLPRLSRMRLRGLALATRIGYPPARLLARPLVGSAPLGRPPEGACCFDERTPFAPRPDGARVAGGIDAGTIPTDRSRGARAGRRDSQPGGADAELAPRDAAPPVPCISGSTGRPPPRDAAERKDRAQTAAAAANRSLDDALAKFSALRSLPECRPQNVRRLLDDLRSAPPFAAPRHPAPGAPTTSPSAWEIARQLLLDRGVTISPDVARRVAQHLLSPSPRQQERSAEFRLRRPDDSDVAVVVTSTDLQEAMEAARAGNPRPTPVEVGTV